MPSTETWACAVCGCAREVAERARAHAGLPPLREDAFTCGQQCALALVENEISAIESMLQRAATTGATGLDQPAAWPRTYLPRRAVYVHVLSQTLSSPPT
jgi:hypothetical protein